MIDWSVPPVLPPVDADASKVTLCPVSAGLGETVRTAVAGSVSIGGGSQGSSRGHAALAATAEPRSVTRAADSATSAARLRGMPSSSDFSVTGLDIEVYELISISLQKEGLTRRSTSKVNSISQGNFRGGVRGGG